LEALSVIASDPVLLTVVAGVKLTRTEQLPWGRIVELAQLFE